MHWIIKPCKYWMWKPFHVGQGPQSMHHDIICNQGDQPKSVMNEYGGSGMMVDPSHHPQHMNALKHLVNFWIWSGCWHHFM
jgi:hypothetical protein